VRDRDRLRRLSARLARGRSVDWEAEERAALTESERAAIRELKVVAAMTAFHDAVQSGDESTGMEVSVSVARSLVAGASVGATSVDDAPPSLPPGARWGHLEILELTGRGAFGEVYRARDTRLDRVVALKLLAAEAPSAGDEVVREARLIARVRHPHVVTVHGADRIDGRVGIWMEYLRGETLNRLLKERGALDAREAALIGIDLCRALSAVHAAGIAHRDVKLANVMRAEGGRIVLMDFGLSHETSPAGRLPQSRRLSGTPLFMAPEVLNGAREDARSDIYSLGVVLFALVTGSLPVQAATFSELLSRHERHETRRARDLRPDLPESFVQFLDRALDPDPGARFQSAGEAEKALLHSLGAAVRETSPEPAVAKRRWLVPALAGAALLVLAASVVLVRNGAAPQTGENSAPQAPFGDVPDLTLFGEGAEELFGLTVEGVGDVDSDGFDDVAIAAPLSNEGAFDAGKVYLYRGGPNGLDPKSAWTLAGRDSSQNLGYAIAPFSGLSLDGFADLVIGSPSVAGHGSVLVFPGSRNGLASAPAQVITSPRSASLFGYSLSTGDVNHDGRDDLLVGEPWHPPANSGRAALYLSQGDSFAVAPAWEFIGPPGSQLGIKVAVGGDLNKDGYGDAAIGAPTANFGSADSMQGQVFVFLGSPTGLDSVPVVLYGRQAGGMLGRTVYFAGDVDGDGFQDLCVGSEGGTNGELHEGIAEIYFGRPGGISPYGAFSFEPNVMGANFGGHGGPLGDLNGDGCDDIFLGAVRYQRSEPRAGAAYILYGSRNRSLQTAWFRVGAKAGSWYGAAGGIAGDLNGDRFPDFFVAGPSWDTELGNNTGMVEIFLNTRGR
jgi:hypothetical protein